MCVFDKNPGLWLPELNALAGFKVVEKIGDEHRGNGNFTYPIQALRVDPNAVPGSHERCMHFLPSKVKAEANEMGSYGSHLLACALFPQHAWSRTTDAGHCLHGDLTVPLGCLTCGDGDVSIQVLDRPPLPAPSGYAATADDPLAWVRNLPVVNHN